MKEFKKLLFVFMFLIGNILTAYGSVSPNISEHSCFKCHEEEVTSFSQSHHFKAWSNREKESGTKYRLRYLPWIWRSTQKR